MSAALNSPIFIGHKSPPWYIERDFDAACKHLWVSLFKHRIVISNYVVTMERPFWDSLRVRFTYCLEHNGWYYMVDTLERSERLFIVIILRIFFSFLPFRRWNKNPVLLLRFYYLGKSIFEITLENAWKRFFFSVGQVEIGKERTRKTDSSSQFFSISYICSFQIFYLAPWLLS